MSIECFHGDDPAFPRSAFLGPNGELEAKAQDGMTLRDYFAAKVMQGLVANEYITRYLHDANVRSAKSGTRLESIHAEQAEAFALASYNLADAMVAARNKPQA